MNATLGAAGVSLGLGACILGLVTTVTGIVRRRLRLVQMGRAYAFFVLGGAVLAFAAMERAIITRDFSLKYVTEVGSSKTPAVFNVAAIWSALEGSILLWALILSGYVALVAFRYRRRMTDPLVAWALSVLFVIAGFFFALMIGPANPFHTVTVPPLDGLGPNPLLQDHILMAFHPPLLYLGYVGVSVPFAFAVAALITGRVGEGWLLETRRWTLISWGFLTVGIILGAWWAYEVLGWGGFWSWDPVENASFLPWLTGTAYLHSVMVQERRGMFRVWNLSLLCATFSLTILGTFLTRSGVLDSVHAFTESGMGPWLLSFFGLIVAVTIGLIGWRGDKLRAPGVIDSPVSREGAFLANNVLFSVFAFVVLLGTVFPLVIEALRNEKLSVGRPYFDRMTMPLGLLLLTLMAIAPVLPWRKAGQAVLRDRLFWPAWAGVAGMAASVVLGASGWAPVMAFGLGGFAAGSAVRQVALATRRQGLRGLMGRANGGMIVHLGVILIAVALTAANSYSHSYELALTPGQSATVGGHTYTYEGETKVDTPRIFALKAKVRIDGGQVYEPAIQRFNDRGQSVLTPSVHTGLASDLYLTFEGQPDTADGPARIKVLVMPLALWLWIGGGVIALGTLLAAFPGRRRNPLDPVSAPVIAGAAPVDLGPVSGDETAAAPSFVEPADVGSS